MLALHGGRVIAEPHAAPVAATVLVDGDSIASIGETTQVPLNAEIVDCSDCTIVAGLWNNHVHFFERKWSNCGELPANELEAQLRGLLGFGFTTVFDLSSNFKNTDLIRKRIDSGEVRGPRIFTTGEGIVPAGFAFPDVAYAVLGQTKVSLPQVSNEDDARSAVTQLLGEPVDAIKLFASTPSGASLSTEIMVAAVAVAHDAGVPVFVHPNNDDDVLRATQARADIIAHTTPPSGPWNAALLDAMAAADVALIPTLALWQHFAKHDRVSIQQAQVQNAVGQLQVWNARGGTILFGTDFGLVDPDPTNEYELMYEAGMGFDDILASLTTTPAQRFGAGDSLGKVAPGFQADLAIVRGDPTQTIAALADIQCVVRAGLLTMPQEH